MTKTLRFFRPKRRWIIILGILIGLSQILPSCSTMTDKKVRRSFRKSNVTPDIQRYEVMGRQVRYTAVGDSTKRMILFVHGAPGSMSSLFDYLKEKKLNTRAWLISVDRPGYGDSGGGDSEISIEKQAAMIKPILERNHCSKPPILVGHSYGGPIIARLAMDYPELTGPLVMAAPVLDPENEKIFWISYPAEWWIFRWLVPGPFKVANDEKFAHSGELAKMLPLWDKVTNDVTVIHGEKDWIAPIVNIEFAEKMLTNANANIIRRKDVGHTFVFRQPKIVYDAIFKYLDEE